MLSTGFATQTKMSSEATTDNENGDFTAIHNVALVDIQGPLLADAPGTVSVILGVVKDAGANVLMISKASSGNQFSFAVQQNKLDSVTHAIRSAFHREFTYGRLTNVEIIPDCSILASVGQRMSSSPGHSGSLLDTLAKDNIDILAIAQGCSDCNVSVALKREDCIKSITAARSINHLSVVMGIVGPGLIGATLLDQLRDQAAILKQDFNIDVRVMGITGSKTMVISDHGINLSRWRETHQEMGEKADLESFTQRLFGNQCCPNKVLVDCTADSKVASQYYEWLHKGIHVITPNKKANSGPLDQYLKLRALQRRSYTHYFYEATVGAGLPIISTLQGFQETGDKILRIEGILSGTLSYIFNSFIGDRAFSEVVAEAKQAGYTEPDPRDDLSGTDVARKVIILARESGLKLELSDIPVQSLVPDPLQASSSAEEFMELLPQFDQDMAKKRHDAETSGEVLRYVGVVDAVNNKGTVELRRYKKDHPFARLSGSDNIISFRTTRYKENPLIIIGPGAGAQVTAGGVFSDILRLASHLGAPS